MPRSAFPCCLAALLLAPAGAWPAPAPGPDREAKAVIARALEAKGGAANVRRFRAMTYKFTGTFSADALDSAVSGTSEEQSPDKAALRSTLKVGGTDVSFVQVVNGAKGWVAVNGGVEEMNKDMLAEMRENLYAGEVADLRALTGTGFKLTALGESRVAGRRAEGVRVSSAGHRDVTLYFDKDKGLLLQCETVGKEPTAGKRYTVRKVFADYKNISGLMVPFKMTVFHDGTPYLTMDLADVSVSEKLPDATFEKP